MGLSASQARLLTITSRKSDCEYQSMRLSHQKIALSREMNEISNEYQNSLNQTILYYDFYGKGDTSNPLNYNLLMTPSALNDYLPTLITNQQGRVVVDSAIATAAKAAGIPQEGLNGLPSEDMRNAFIEGLFQAGVISKKTRDSILSTVYNQAAGVGSTDMITTQYIEADLETLLEYIRQNTTASIDMSLLESLGDSGGRGNYLEIDHNRSSDYSDLTLYNLLSDAHQYNIEGASNYKHAFNHTSVVQINKWMTDSGGFIDQIYEEFSNLLNVDPVSANALDYARYQTQSLFQGSLPEANSNEFMAQFGTKVRSRHSHKHCYESCSSEVDKCIGYVYSQMHKAGLGIGGDSRRWGSTQLNLNNIVKAFLSYYAQYMEKLAIEPNYSAFKGYKDKSNLVTDDPTYIYKINAGSSITEEDAKSGLFYDTLFNQLCIMGWTENNEVKDQSYLQEMLKNGMMFISSIGDDDYYYQENYNTNTFVKEKSDDSFIAQAEAKYTNQKARLTSKEDELDLKMKNLDTEISSLTTEYDSVKSVIDKNIEKSFKRYDA